VVEIDIRKMVKTIIEAYSKEKKEASKDEVYLNVAECFSQTIQGEGINIGKPAVFLRLKNCTLSCHWCDSKEVWREGNPYTIIEILDLFESNGVVEDLLNHLVLTGGSPLLQQDGLIELIRRFKERFEFIPYIEIENECTIIPKKELVNFISCWNNSPKLENSGMKRQVRFKPEVLDILDRFKNSWFKFVISNESDWEEIKRDFIDTNIISDKNKILLMPEGMTRNELQRNYQKVLAISIKEGLTVTDRLHITIWDKKVGV
jgi:organic radical activating enzyme